MKTITFPAADLFGDGSLYFHLGAGSFTQGTVTTFYFLGGVPFWGTDDEPNMYDVFGPRESVQYTFMHTSEPTALAQWSSAISDFNEVMSGLDSGDTINEGQFASPLNVSLDYNYYRLNPGKQVTLHATQSPDPSLYPAHLREYLSGITWITGNKEVVTVDSNGTITAVGVGETSVTAWDTMGNYAQATIVVNNEGDFSPNFSGSGTESDPYLLRNATDLETLSSYLQNENYFAGRKAYYRVEADIDMSENTTFTPLGSADFPFQGHFDGNGHTITLNLQRDANASATKDLALFGFVMGNASARASITNVIVDGNVFSQSGAYTAGLVARCDYLDITQCQNKANISGCYYTGGLVGYASCVPDMISGNLSLIGGTTIARSCNTGTISAHGKSEWNSGCKYVGGIAGYVRGALKDDGAAGISSLVNCYNAGTVSSTDDHLAGLVGRVAIAGNSWTIDDGDNPSPCATDGISVYGSDATPAAAVVAARTSDAAASDETRNLGVLLENCFNAGVVSSTKTSEATQSALVGSYDVNLNDPNPNKFIIRNCHYLDQGFQGVVDGSAESSYALIENCTAQTQSTMSQSAFVTQMGSAFVKGTTHPLLTWQATGAEPVITKTSEAVVVNQGESARISVEAALPTTGAGKSGTLTYQWYSATDELGTNLQTLNGQTNAQLSAPTNEQGVFYYLCEVTNTYATGAAKTTAVTLSDIVRVTVLSNTSAATPTITTQPQAETSVMVLTPTTLSVEATIASAQEGGGELSYQWYEKTATENVALEGATSASFSVDTSAVGTRSYYCVVTNTFETYKTATATSSIARVSATEAVIHTPEQLELLAQNVATGASYAGLEVTLANNLDLSAYDAWAPIGSKSAPFKGTFNGQGYTISNLTVNGTSGEDWGLFGYVSDGAVLENMIVKGTVTGTEGVGGIVGHTYGEVTLSHLGFEGSLRATGSLTTETLGGAGGIVGRVGNGGFGKLVSINHCYNKAAIICDGNSAGGIVGTSGHSLEVANCYNTGIVSARNKAGGIVGIGYYQFENYIVNCYNAGFVSISESIEKEAALIGGITGGNSYYYNDRGASTTCQPSYFLEGSAESGEGSAAPYATGTLPSVVGIDTLVSADFATSLGSAYKQNLEGRYPLLAWEALDASNVDSLDKANVVLEYETTTYDAAAKEPSVNVTLDGTALTPGSDYRLAYSNNTNAGTAKAIVLGMGNYVGAVVKTFTISPAAVSESCITPLEDATFSAKNITPAISATMFDTALVQGRDFSVTYNNNYHAGNASATVRFTGNYTGLATLAFTIAPENIASSNVVVAYIPNQTLGSEPCTPLPQLSLNNVELTANTDFVIDEYINNNAVGVATIKLSGTGDLTGTRNVQFRIQESDADTNPSLATASAEGFILNMGISAPAITVKDTNGKTLVAQSDYTVHYTNASGDDVSTFTKPGTYTAHITGVGSYAQNEDLQASFTVKAKPLSHVSIVVQAIPDEPYTGTSIEPAITLSDQITGATLRLGYDYVVEYENNARPGKASVIATGIGSYTSNTTVHFTIYDNEEPGYTPEKFARATYEKLLFNSNPTNAQVSFWTERYNTQPALDVIKELLASDAFYTLNASHRECANGLYELMCATTPVTSTLDELETYLNEGHSVNQLADKLASTSEWTQTIQTYGLKAGGTTEGSDMADACTPSAWVKMLYRELLNINYPRQSQIDYWLEVLSTESAETVVEGFVNSSAWSERALSPEETVRTLYAGILLNTNPSAFQMDYWTSELNNGKSAVEAAREFTQVSAFDDVCTTYHLKETTTPRAAITSYGNATLLTYSPSTPITQGCPTYKGEKLFWIPTQNCWARVLPSTVGSASVNASEIYDSDFSIDETAEVISIARPAMDSSVFDAERYKNATQGSQLIAGDVNCNGRMNIVDAQIAYNIACGKMAINETDFTQVMWLTADVNSNNDIEASDAFAIQVACHQGW